MTAERVALIRSRLEAAFAPDELEIIDVLAAMRATRERATAEGIFKCESALDTSRARVPSSAIGWFMLPWAR